MPRGDPAERTLTSPGRPTSRRQARRGSRVSSTASWKVQGTFGEGRGEVACRPRCRPRGRRRGTRTTRPRAPHGQVVLGQPDQPGQLATGGGPGVVEPEQHEDRHVGVAADRRDRGDLGRQAPPVTGRADDVQPVRAALDRARHVALVRDRDLQQDPHGRSLGVAGSPPSTQNGQGGHRAVVRCEGSCARRPPGPRPRHRPGGLDPRGRRLRPRVVGRPVARGPGVRRRAGRPGRPGRAVRDRRPLAAVPDLRRARSTRSTSSPTSVARTRSGSARSPATWSRRWAGWATDFTKVRRRSTPPRAGRAAAARRRGGSRAVPAAVR